MKIAIASGLATAGVLSAVFGLFVVQEWRVDRAQFAGGQMDIAEALIHDTGASAVPGQGAVIARANRRLAEVSWFGAGGERRTLFSGAYEAPEPRRPADARWTIRFTSGGLVASRPHIGPSGQPGTLLLRASTADLQARLARRAALAAVLTLAGGLIAALLAGYLAGKFVRPLAALQRHINVLRASKDFGRRLPLVANDELGRLTASFNALLEELMRYDQRLQDSLDELTEARDEAQSATILKSQFLANMSHEIRTPLNGVLGMAQVMSMEPLSGAQRKRLEVVQQSGKDLLLILNNVLDLSKIEAGRLELEVVEFDLPAEVAGACAVLEPLALAKGVGFTLTIAQEVDGLWSGDPTRLRQLLYNLASNALKFTSEGEVRVAVTAGAEGGLRLAVFDTGIGIAPEALTKLFNDFVQADGATARRFGGTGLGLTICRRIVDRMGGTLNVESRLGQGSVFTAALPLVQITNRDGAPGVAAESAQVSADLSRLQVLAVDDNETNRLVLRSLLEALGVESVMVEDGRQAIEAWQAANFDLVFMDIQMPEMDGVAATREIRRREAARGLAPTRIVALTANVMNHQVAEYLAAGFDDHLAKPICLEELYCRLVQALEADGVAEPIEARAG